MQFFVPNSTSAFAENSILPFFFKLSSISFSRYSWLFIFCSENDYKFTKAFFKIFSKVFSNENNCSALLFTLLWLIICLDTYFLRVILDIKIMVICLWWFRLQTEWYSEKEQYMLDRTRLKLIEADLNFTENLCIAF